MLLPFSKVGMLFLSLLMFSVNAAQLCNDDGAKTMPSERYVIFANDYFVRDRVTGLEWTRCAIGQTWDTDRGICLENTKKQVKSWFSFNSAAYFIIMRARSVIGTSFHVLNVSLAEAIAASISASVAQGTCANTS